METSTLLAQFLHYLILSGGLLAILPLLLIVILAIGIERWWLLSHTMRSSSRLQAAVRRVSYRNVAALRTLTREQGQTLGGHLVAIAIASRGATAEEVEMHLDEEVMCSTPRLLRGLWVLDTAVTIAPLLGLFGTIIGLMQTFNVLSAHGGAAEVTGGIADALISTGAGVFVAIVAVCFLNVLNAMLASITFQIDTIKLALLNRLHSGGQEMDPAFTIRTMRPAVQGVVA